MNLADTLDSVAFVGLAVTNVHTGYNASIEFEDGVWSPHVFGTSPSEAIAKAIREHGPRVAPPSAPVLAPPSTSDAPVLAPPPY